MVSVMGKKKKMPTTLGVNLKTGIILIAPEQAQDGPTQEWTAEKMTHYSREGKHVFLELVRPSKSIDFHAGAKDTAEEIVSALGELSGAVKAEGLREVIAAGTGQGVQRRGQILYDFMAQGNDEVTVGVGDEVIILDDTKSEEWWQVRRLRNGKEGVVPSSYVERVESLIPPSTAGISAGMSSVAQNRQDEARLTREAVRKDHKTAEVGPKMSLLERQSSLLAGDSGNLPAKQRSKRENSRAEPSRSGPSKSKPDPSKVRVWTDRSKSFSVEAQFLGLKDGKINLHKMNGVKIAVPLAKMSMEDIEYVERTLGISLDEEKPLADVKRAKTMRNNASKGDLLLFISRCCRWVMLNVMHKRLLGNPWMRAYYPTLMLAYYEISVCVKVTSIKVMRFLDKKFERDGKRRNAGAAGEGDGDTGSTGGLFSGPGGTLRNNTRKGRPTPTVQTSDVVDAKALSQPKDGEMAQSASPTPEESRSAAPTKGSSGFEDDAWDVKPARQPATQSKPAPSHARSFSCSHP
ncbi:hypothetical protein NUW58_g10355 [Xylaria curta]|uniref:Uncharacterized protein n=1 Tax=Xylaria curta TaxID=42375 RepID=A0ACC1MLY6_9PEZI|nr:hypothetical protein NUW58_g10355 [Xylaria curta]